MIALLLTALAWADRPPEPIAPDIVEDPVVLIGDLTSDTPKLQVYAARELRRQARRAVGDLHNRDEIRAAEARLQLELFDTQLAPACMTVLSVSHLTAPCADILRTLETAQALPVLRDLSTQLRGHRARRVQQAIVALESL